MIGRLNGILLEKQPPLLLLDVGGVAYEVEASMNTFYRLPDIGKTVSLHTHLTIRDDAHLLYGFFEKQEKKLFQTLIKVNGVGPKLALTILSSINPDEFARCVAEHDTASLVRLPGVGKKTSERLVVEMRDKLKDWQISGVSVESGIAPAFAGQLHGSSAKDALSALINLGYKPQEANRMVANIKTSALSSEEIIRQALQGRVEETT